MAGIQITREGGRWSFRAQGCCGNLDAWQREYERAFVEQVLAVGGRVAADGDGQISLIDRRGRRHQVSASACAMVGSAWPAEAEVRPVG